MARKTAQDAGNRGQTPALARLAIPIVIAVVLVACSSPADSDAPSDGVSSAPPASSDTASAPPASPGAEIDPALVSAAEAEGGQLDIYSNTSEENWAPIFEAFQEAYPFVESVSANDLGSDEVFERYLSETAAGTSAADLLVTNATSAWATFAARGDVLAEYEPSQLAGLPEFATLLPNVFAMSMDPVTIGYNSSLLPEGQRPTGMSSLAEIVSASPDQFDDMITYRDVEGSFGFSVAYPWVNANPDAWDVLAQILPLTRPEDSSGTQIEKITTGEYVAGFWISGAVAYPAVEDSDGLFAATYLDDGTVVLPRGIGITATAPHPATAQLFVEFVLSQAGQEAVSRGGLTAYREGIDGERTYQDLEEEIGADGIIIAEYEEISEEDINAFVEQWTELVGQ